MPRRRSVAKLHVQLMNRNAAQPECSGQIALNTKIAQPAPPSKRKKQRSQNKPTQPYITLRHFKTDDQREHRRSRITVELVHVAQPAIDIEQQRARSRHWRPRL